MPEGVAVAAPKYFAFDGDGDDDFVCTADFATFVIQFHTGTTTRLKFPQYFLTGLVRLQ